jgi:16S rRNA (adenine1518-N6/adenine1519-N6)-dimethyltransferase
MPSPLEELKALLDAYRLRPQKRFGQNFMVDPNFARSIALSAQADEHTLVVEVGPGTGLLSRAILQTHPRARLLAIEIDRKLPEILVNVLATERADGRFSLLCGDVLASKHAVNAELLAEIKRIKREEARPRLVLCANLPYNAATALLMNLLLNADPELHFERLIGTVQLEMAQRVVGRVDTNDYGPLAILTALRAQARIVRKVGPEIFWPRPQIDSAVLEVEPRTWEQSDLQVSEAEDFPCFVQMLFQHRRKALRGVCLKRFPNAAALLSPFAQVRAETLSPQALLTLYRQLMPTEIV